MHPVFKILNLHGVALKIGTVRLRRYKPVDYAVEYWGKFGRISVILKIYALWRIVVLPLDKMVFLALVEVCSCFMNSLLAMPEKARTWEEIKDSTW